MKFCTSCGRQNTDGEVCDGCIWQNGNEDLCPEQFCNGCGKDLSELGGFCDVCDELEDDD